eukprot:TRINITY_DN2720_c0_g1_i3.p1 TRINITY_DN2720_c0_g1~~TRINITY_DN2720_c0_g1_i3.p1  ORF type:complete len:636 (-),score=275.80 TRINITY_DN2720_c0_g1_i3:26-1933(-)
MIKRTKKMTKSATAKAGKEKITGNVNGFVGSQYDTKTVLSDYITKNFKQTLVEMYFVHLGQIIPSKKFIEIKVRLGSLIVTEVGLIIVDHQQDFNEESLECLSVPFDKLKSFNVDRKFVGLISFSSTNPKEKDNLVLLDSEESLQQVLSTVESGREKAKKANPSLPQLNITKTFIVDSTEDTVDDESELNEGANSNTAMERLMDYILERGYAVQDVWNGAIDLRALYNECGSQIAQASTPREGAKENFVIEFLFPPGPEFGVFSRLYSVSKKSKIKEIQDLVFTKSKIAHPDRFELTTLALNPLDPEVAIYEYGLGTFFPSWQLKVVDKEYPYTTGTMEVDINLPKHEMFEALEGTNRIKFVVDVLQPINETLEEIFSDLEVKKPHLFQLKFKDQILEDDDTLVRLGFGTTFANAELDIVPKVFPSSSGDKEKDLQIVGEILSEVVQNAIKIGKERHQAAKERMCRGIIFEILRKAVFQTEKSHAFCGRIASLSGSKFSDVMEFLLMQEQEERQRSKIAGYNKMVDSAHDEYMREADAEREASGLVPAAPIFDGRSLLPKKINIFGKKTATASNAVSKAGGFSLAEILSGRGALKKSAAPPPKEKKATSGVSDELFAKLQKRNQQVQARKANAQP